MNIGCGAHIGDCIWITLMLSKLPGEHTLYVQPEYVVPFRDLLQGALIVIEPITLMPPDTQDGWIANGRFPNVHYDGQIDILGFVREYMNNVAAAGRDAIPAPEDMLMDFPSLQIECPALPFDILAVNANPMSGQCPHYSSSEFDGLIAQLEAKGHRVLATNPTSACPWGTFTLPQIGNLSTRCRAILGVASGPTFCTFNIWNKEVPHYIFLDPMRLDYGPTPIKHAACAEQMRVQLTEDGYL